MTLGLTFRRPQQWLLHGGERARRQLHSRQRAAAATAAVGCLGSTAKRAEVLQHVHLERQRQRGKRRFHPLPTGETMDRL